MRRGWTAEGGGGMVAPAAPGWSRHEDVVRCVAGLDGATLTETKVFFSEEGQPMLQTTTFKCALTCVHTSKQGGTAWLRSAY